MLQAPGRAYEVNGGLKFYVPVKTAADSLFPFDGDDPFVVRVVGNAVVITPPRDDREALELPPIDDQIRTQALDK